MAIHTFKVSFRVSEPLHDALMHQAAQEGVTLGEALRRVILRGCSARCFGRRGD